MKKEDIILYADSRFISPYVMSVFVTLTEKGIPFQIKKIRLLAEENLKPDYAKLSLTQRVPSLSHGDFNLSESSAITEYLEELFPAPNYINVYPKDTRQKAKARQVQAWIGSDFMSIREERSTEVVFCKPSDKPLASKPYQHEHKNDKHHSKSSKITPVPVQFGHEFKVHPINPCNERKRDEYGGNDRQQLHDFVHPIAYTGKIYLQHA